MIALAQADPAAGTDPNDLAERLTGRRHLSYSEVRAYQGCPQKWWYQYVQRMPRERASASLLLGIGVHAVIERYFTHLMHGDPVPGLDELMAVYDESWSHESSRAPVQFPKGQDEASCRATASRATLAFLASDAARPAGRVIGLEESFRVRLPGLVPHLAGRVDLLTHDVSDRVLTVTDFKTSRGLWSAADAQLQADQLRLYALGCADIARELDAELKLQFVVVTKAKTPKVAVVPIEVDPARIQRTTAIIERVFAAMQTQAVYPAPNPMHCSTCAFAQRCERGPTDVAK